MRLFKEALTDFVSAVVALVIMITGFRALYLITILSVNGHATRFNPFLKRLTKNSPRLYIKLNQIETLLA